VISALTRFNDIFVYGPGESQGGRVAQIVPTDYRLTGAVTLFRERLHADLQMSRSMDGRYVWTQSFDYHLGDELNRKRRLDLTFQPLT